MLKLFAVAWGLSFSSLAFSAMAQEPPSAQVIATSDPEGLVVRYRLSEPRERVVFTDRHVIRDRWSVITPGLTLADGAITGNQPFKAFELRILPDAAEVDRIYMGLARAGEGRVVFGPGLMIEGVRVALAFEPRAGEAALPAERQAYGYAWVGPASDVAAEAHGDFITGGHVAPELVEALRTTFAGSLSFYEARLGAVTLRPTLIGSVDSPGPAMFRGDVTDTGVISVRFHGDTWRQELPTVVPFVWHETFHLWNGHGIENRDGDDAPWLHEGGADYAAVVGAVSAGAMSEDAGRARLTQALNGCRRVLGARDYDPARLRFGNGPYTCGLLIQWIADLEARKSGTGDFFTVWKSLLDAGRASPNGYGVAEFRALIGPESGVTALLDGSGPERWPTVQARLTELGVVLVNRPGDADLRGAALFHVGGRNCHGSYGFYDNPGALTLDGSDCGPLSGEPVIDTIEGHDPQQASRAMFDAIQARWEENMPIRYATRDGRVLEAVCDAPLLEPEILAVVEAPALALYANLP